MTNQRQGFHDQEAVQHKHLDKIIMRCPQNEDLYSQEQFRQRQEKPKLEKMGKLQRDLKFVEGNVQRVKSKL